MKKILLALILMFTFSAGIVTAKTTAINGLFDGFQIVKLFSNGKEIKPDKIPGINYKGNTLIPIGSLRALGADVIWDAQTYSVNVKLPQRTVPVLTAGQLDELSKYVYEVQAPLPDDPTKARQGSGFLVNGTMITNAHVIGDSTSAQVQIDGAWQKVSSFSFINKDVDLAGMKVSGGKELPISTEPVQVGDIVYAIGFPHGELKVTEGEVSNVREFGGVTNIVHTAAIDNGNSGGILISGKGAVIGINTEGTVVNGKNINYAIAIRYALDELNK